MLHIFVGSSRESARAGSTGRVVPGYVAEDSRRRGWLRSGRHGRTACRQRPDGLQVSPRRAPKRVRTARLELSRRRVPSRRRRILLVRRAHRRHDRLGRLQHIRSGSRAALIAHADVKEVAVVAKRDAAKETNIVKAFVVLVDGCASSPEKADELRDFCKTQIAPFKAPREIEFVAVLPRTETGKLQRYKLRVSS